MLVTGATGCVGHYLVARLVDSTPHDLVLLVRDPAKLRGAAARSPRVSIVQSDLARVGEHAALVASVDCAVLLATSWGPEDDAFAVNVDATLALLGMLDPARCRRVVYFSTASILSDDGAPLPEARAMGTPYIRSKYECKRAIDANDSLPPITTLYPTLVVGGDATTPSSHLANLLREAWPWVWLLRFLSGEGSFHFMHAADIADIVLRLLEASDDAPRRAVVLGNPAVTVDEAIDVLARRRGLRRLGRLPLPELAAKVLVPVFRVQLSPWDRYCMAKRHFTYRDAVGPQDFGLEARYPTLDAALASLALR